jgi:hypothetical protein
MAYRFSAERAPNYGPVFYENMENGHCFGSVYPTKVDLAPIVAGTGAMNYRTFCFLTSFALRLTFSR